MSTERFTVGVALDGVGWHPSARAEDPAAPGTLDYWSGSVATLEQAGVDYVTIEDTFSGWSPDWRAEAAGAAGRLDAHTVAAFLAGRTERIGLIPTATTTLTEPYHLATRLQTLDFATRGRAGWQVRVSAGPEELRLTALGEGRRPALADGEIDETALVDLFDEAAAVIATARALWDSWEDDAEIRDAATGRFLDGGKLHHVDAQTPWFSVAGPSIVPRSPSGQVLVAALAHATVPYRLAVRGADVVFVTPGPGNPLSGILAEIRELERAEERAAPPLRVVADLLVAVGADAADRYASLQHRAPVASDAEVVVGSAEQVADRIAQLRDEGADGVRLRPAENAHDVTVLAHGLLPLLESRGVHGSGTADGLRGAFGLPRPPSRYARNDETLAGAR
ncbi:LLM class flavin-dependent oxidoreductase [Pseudactinotalea sp.]|uniref:LLM class flavin-dependent oxidoreductase n=1 Tax=Pseudactinotalea sp. TaxID=1926260 RepID=UPI003B3A4951